jgi:hypothetical protein
MIMRSTFRDTFNFVIVFPDNRIGKVRGRLILQRMQYLLCVRAEVTVFRATSVLSSNLKNEAVRSSETTVMFYYSSRRPIP